MLEFRVRAVKRDQERASMPSDPGQSKDPNAAVFGNNRFYVEVGQAKVAVFTEISGLQIEIETLEVLEGGRNEWTHKLPGRTKVGNITLKRGVVSLDEDGNKGLVAWLEKTMQGKIERQQLSVIMYDLVGKPVRRWDFTKAIPVKWTGPQFQATGNTAAIETFEFAHLGLVMPKQVN